MKRLLIHLFSAAVLVTPVLFYSCAKNDKDGDIGPDAPEVVIITSLNGTLVTGLIEAHPGDQITFDIEVFAQAGFHSYRLFTAIDNSDPSKQLEILWEDLELEQFEQTMTDSRNYEIPSGLVGKSIVFEFEAEDQAGQVGTASVEVTVVARIASRSAITLYPPVEEGTSKTFYSAGTGMAYSLEEIETDDLYGIIDFGYTYSETLGKTLAAPVFFAGTTSWSVINTITFRKTAMDAAAFNAVTTFSDINTAFDAAAEPDDTPAIETIEVGEVWAFATDPTKPGGSKRGLLRVKSSVAGEEGHVELEVVVQEEEL